MVTHREIKLGEPDCVVEFIKQHFNDRHGVLSDRCERVEVSVVDIEAPCVVFFLTRIIDEEKGDWTPLDDVHAEKFNDMLLDLILVIRLVPLWHDL